MRLNVIPAAPKRMAMFGFSGNHFGIGRRFTACLIAFFFCALPRLNGRARGLFPIEIPILAIRTRAASSSAFQFFDFSLKGSLQLNVFGFTSTVAPTVARFFILVFYFRHFFLSFGGKPAYLRVSKQGRYDYLAFAFVGCTHHSSGGRLSPTLWRRFPKTEEPAAHSDGYPAVGRPSPFRLTIAL